MHKTNKRRRGKTEFRAWYSQSLLTEILFDPVHWSPVSEIKIKIKINFWQDHSQWSRSHKRSRSVLMILIFSRKDQWSYPSMVVLYFVLSPNDASVRAASRSNGLQGSKKCPSDERKENTSIRSLALSEWHRASPPSASPTEAKAAVLALPRRWTEICILRE